MQREEIALQLTLKAMDAHNIIYKGKNDGTYEDVTAFNAKQTADFYNALCERLCDGDDNSVIAEVL